MESTSWIWQNKTLKGEAHRFVECWNDASAALSWMQFLTDEKHFCSLEITARQPNDYIQTFQSLEIFASESQPNMSNGCPEGKLLFGKRETAITDCHAEPGNSITTLSSASCFCSALMSSTTAEAAIQEQQTHLYDATNCSNKNCGESLHWETSSLASR